MTAESCIMVHHDNDDGKETPFQNEDDDETVAFYPIPCTTMEHSIPLTQAEMTDGKMNKHKEFLLILELLPTFIQENIPYTVLETKFQEHCCKVKESERSMVIIDGGRFEFYICKHASTLYQDCMMFDDLIMTLFLNNWDDHNSGKRRYITNSITFRRLLHKYIWKHYKDDGDYDIHSISFILDYPGTSEVRQWSHIDGEATMFQGSVLCGNGTPITMEFPVLKPHVKGVEDLKAVWKQFLPENSVFYTETNQSDYSLYLLEKYGCLLNHDAKHPKNPVSAQKKEAREQAKKNINMKNWNSIYPAGTIIRMKGNTIHAGPASDKKLCRAIFFYAASPTSGNLLYDPENQWNQATLCCTILLEVWESIPQLERALILEYIQTIQSDDKIAPSDTSLFVTNYTLRLFIRICLFLHFPNKGGSVIQMKFQEFISKLSQIPDINPKKQFITAEMINDLDPSLLSTIFKIDEPGSSKDLFLFEH
jgi:hypothetical protein